MTYLRLLISLPFCCGALVAAAGQYGQNPPPANQQNQQQNQQNNQQQNQQQNQRQNQQQNQPPAGGPYDPRPLDPAQGGGNQQSNQPNAPQGGGAGSMANFPRQGGRFGQPNPDAPPLAFDIRPRLSPIRRTTSLVGMNVTLAGTAGAPFGTVTDLVFNENGCTQYLLVSHDGRLLLVPWKAATVGYDTWGVALKAHEADIQAMSFAENNWPDLNDADWITRTQAAFGLAPRMRDRVVTAVIGSIVRLRGQTGNWGTVEDMIFTEDGCAAYAVLGFEGRRLVLAPWSAVHVNYADRLAVVDVTPERLTAISFTADHWPDVTDLTYLQRVTETYAIADTVEATVSREPGSPGYVPPREDRTLTPRDLRILKEEEEKQMAERTRRLNEEIRRREEQRKKDQGQPPPQRP